MNDELLLIDWTIIVFYMIGVLGIGTYFGRYIKSAGDYFLAGRALPFWAIGMSVVVSDIGAMDFISGAGAAYRFGLAQANFDWIGSMPAMIIAALVFIPYYWRAGVYTIPEFLGRRFHPGVQVFSAIFWLVFLVFNLAVMLWLTATLLDQVLGMNIYAGIWMTVLIVGIYTVAGGLSAVVMTDVCQLVVMFVGGTAMMVLSIWEVGGISGLRARLEDHERTLGMDFSDHLQLLLPHDTSTPYPWSGIVFGLGIVLAISYFVGNQAVVQRVLGARTEWDAKAGMLFAGFLKLFIPLLVFVPGLAMVAMDPTLEQADFAIPTLIKLILPPGLKGLMFAAFFAALMSSVDSYLNSCATVFTTDIYGRARSILGLGVASERHRLILGQVLTGVLIVIAASCAPLLAESETPIYVIIQDLLSFFQGPTLAILVLGIFWRRATGWGGFAGLVLGVLFTYTFSIIGEDVFPSDNPFLFVAFYSFLFSLAVTIIVSLLTPRDPEEKLRGLVYGSVLGDDHSQELLRERLSDGDADAR